MRRLGVFLLISLDGFFAVDGDPSWPRHSDDPEWKAFAEGNSQGGGALVFGRSTYEMMVKWWPTPMALQAMPVIARRMNEMPKVVFSRTLTSASWSNTTLEKGDLETTIRRMKSGDGPDMTILGSGSIVSQLTAAGLIDDYQIVVAPVALGRGRTMFEGMTRARELKLVTARAFRNGNVLLHYEPAAGS